MPNNRYNGGYGGYNRNNGNNRYNGNYRNNGNRYNNDRRYDNRPANDVETISLVKYKKKNILIEDMNGKKFVISGNFPSEFIAEMAIVAEKYKQYENITEENVDPAVFAEMFEMMKEWCLKLINMNVDGKVYTMADINAGFNDFDALVYVYHFIVKQTATKVKESENLTKR